MAATNETNTSASDSDESLAPATEELVFRVVSSLNSSLDDLVRRFPEAAEFLRLTAPVLPRESTVEVTPSAANANPAHDANGAEAGEGTAGGPCPSSILARGQAHEICRKFEGDLKKGLGPCIENCVRDVAEPQRSALLSMLVAAELRFRLRNGERPTLEQYCTRFSAHSTIIEAVFAASVGPDRIGSFGVLRFVGGGTFGRVYLCRDAQLDRLVAIKVPRPGSLSGPEEIERFLREARLAAKIKHPGIVSVYQVDRDPAVGCFVVLEYIEGRPLSAHLDKKRLAPTATAGMIISIAEALSFAHEQGLVHRDLKPANILLDLKERPHIADFGLAVHEDERWPSRGEVAGTPPYMAPEQVRGESHRLDGRTDIWGLGVILYRMLTGHRPFDGTLAEEVFDEILHREPVPPRQRDRTVPKELERICLKCLSKRMTDRYATATDLANDLDAWLAHAANQRQGDHSKQREPKAGKQPGETSDDESGALAGMQIRPKGLRSFDIDDRDFFLGLLPGPRDRDGLPESLRFWKVRIEPGERVDPFCVGLLCGPSGSGKTSMVKAGLVCQLSSAVLPVYVESSPGATEARLKAALDRIVVGGTRGLTLTETISGLRARVLLPAGKKVLIVLDQFEQWLHADRDDNGELIRALRQCDGVSVQCLVLVRDDFAMAAARFMHSLEIRLVESENFATVDLFDQLHARKVLRAFGAAYDRFGFAEKGDANRFLDQAVSELAVDGKIAPVRLALFAQMLKDKPWTPTTLRNVGGLEGIGLTFLEESLAGPAANPEHRLHLAAARQVLKTLLPQGGADIKGHMRSHDELLEISGYALSPHDFETLLSILGPELRLITPTDPRGHDFESDPAESASAERYYHLTHDYLVPSLRQWITRKQRETRKGRVELMLANLSAFWCDRPERRRLPSPLEWLVILWYLPTKSWSNADRKMMNAATRHYVFVGTAVLALAASIGLGAYVVRQRDRDSSLLQRALRADFRHFGGLLAELDSRHGGLRPALERIENTESASDRDREVAEILLYRDRPTPKRARVLRERLQNARMDELSLIGETLALHPADAGADELRRAVIDESADAGVRLRSACALAMLEPAFVAPADRSSAALTQAILAEDRRLVTRWVQLLGSSVPALVPELSRICCDPGSDPPTRSTAAEALAEAVVRCGEVENLGRFVVDSQPDASRILLNQLIQLPEKRNEARGFLQSVLTEKGVGSTKELVAKRQARACVALAAMGDVEIAWPYLRHNDDPCVRSYLIQNLAAADFLRQSLIDRLVRPGLDAIERQAVLLAWAESKPGGISPSHRAQVMESAARLYLEDQHPAVHSAAELLLRRWGNTEILDRCDQRLKETGQRPLYKGWCTGPNEHTFAILTGPLECRLGSPVEEEGREDHERAHYRRIDRALAVSTKEVSFDQFRRFQGDRIQKDRFATSPLCPVNNVTWYEGAAYCNWLTDQDPELTKEDRCYAGNVKSGMRLVPDALERHGYRLPTEAEWEYFCRGKTITSRPFGESEELLPRFAWTWLNSQDRLHPVGLLLPNEFGLFDVLGNAYEWCHDGERGKRLDPYTPYPEGTRDHPAGDPDEGRATLDDTAWRMVRGGAYCYAPASSRSAARYTVYVTLNDPYMGFRVVRTLQKERD